MTEPLVRPLLCSLSPTPHDPVMRGWGHDGTGSVATVIVSERHSNGREEGLVVERREGRRERGKRQ